MKIDTDFVLKLMNDFENWRESYNGSKYGYGLDEYCKDMKYEYPEAYAKFGNGYLLFYRVTGDKSWFHKAKECANWLLENYYTDFDNYSWGLPFKFKSVPAFSSYLITTVFCCDFLLRAYNMIGRNDYLSAVLGASKWILNELYRKNGNEYYFLYSPYNCLKYNIYNATSLTAGFYVKLEKTTKGNYKKIYENVVNNIVSKQSKNSLWKYSDFNETIDCLHTAYTLEGLVEYLSGDGNNNKVKKAFDKGMKAFKNSFVSPNGFCFMRLPLGFSSSVKKGIKELSKNSILKFRRFFRIYSVKEGARLWGYAAAIRLFVKSNDLEFAVKILTSAAKNLYNKEGFFNYKWSEPSIFIRHEAHMFESMGYFVEKSCESDIH